MCFWKSKQSKVLRAKRELKKKFPLDLTKFIESHRT